MTEATNRMRTAIVTGAASGIGAATVALLIARGYRVACIDRDAPGLRNTRPMRMTGSGPRHPRGGALDPSQSSVRQYSSAELRSTRAIRTETPETETPERWRAEDAAPW